MGTLIAFSPTQRVNAGEGNYGQVAFDLQLLGFLETDLLLLEYYRAPQFVVAVLEQDILIDERADLVRLWTL